MSFCCTFSQTDLKPESSVSAQDSLRSPKPGVNIQDNAYLIKDDSTYTLTIGLIKRIKNAYFVSARTRIMDSTVYVKILEPYFPKSQKNKRIRKRGVYDIQLNRLFPYPLAHPIDCYCNYNFFFGKKIVSVQATDCMSYVFTSDDLDGLFLTLNHTDDSLHPVVKYALSHQLDSTSHRIIRSIIMHTHEIYEYADLTSVLRYANRLASPFSKSDLKHDRCVPPYRLKKPRNSFKHQTRQMDLSDKLYHLLGADFFLRKITSIDFLETDMVYYDNRYVTYRIVWASPDLPTGIKNVTYISFRVASGSVKMVGYSSIN